MPAPMITTSHSLSVSRADTSIGGASFISTTCFVRRHVHDHSFQVENRICPETFPSSATV